MKPTETIHEEVRRRRRLKIVEVANRLLAVRGYEAMTIDEVAQEAGISKMGLYRYFASKDLLAAAAMVDLQERTLAQIGQIEQVPALPAVERLRMLVEWALREQFDERMPSLPTQDSALTAALMADTEYTALLGQVVDRMTLWIAQAQADGAIAPSLPGEVVLLTVFARACDPVLPMLKSAGHPVDHIVDWMLSTCFDGLAGQPAVRQPAKQPAKKRAHRA